MPKSKARKSKKIVTPTNVGIDVAPPLPRLDDLVPRRTRLMRYDAWRLEVWQRSHKNLAPTMELAYGFAVAQFLDGYELGTKMPLLAGVERPK